MKSMKGLFIGKQREEEKDKEVKKEEENWIIKPTSHQIIVTAKKADNKHNSFISRNV